MDAIINKFIPVYSQIRKEKGRFFLFMILKMDEYADKWSVVVSAPWITEDNFKNSFNYIAKEITSSLSEEEVSSIARLGIFQPEEHLVELITRSINTRGKYPMFLENTKVNGHKIHEAYIFESHSQHRS